MNTCKRHRYPPDSISQAVWLYFRFNPGTRDMEDLLAERGITVTCEAIRTRQLKRRHRGYGDAFYIDCRISRVWESKFVSTLT